MTEAMWKEQPVVGTSETGLRYQIVQQTTGFVADETGTCVAHVLALLEDRELALKLGNQAREHVRKEFLLPVTVWDHLKTMMGAVSA